MPFLYASLTELTATVSPTAIGTSGKSISSQDANLCIFQSRTARTAASKQDAPAPNRTRWWSTSYPAANNSAQSSLLRLPYVPPTSMYENCLERWSRRNWRRYSSDGRRRTSMFWAQLLVTIPWDMGKRNRAFYVGVSPRRIITSWERRHWPYLDPY